MGYILEYTAWKNSVNEQAEELNTTHDATYDYKKVGDQYYTKKKSEKDWILTSGTQRDAIMTKVFSKTDTKAQPATTKVEPAKTQTVAKPVNTLSNIFANKEEGDKFRKWVNSRHSDYAKTNKLDISGSFDNKFIKDAYKQFGGEYEFYLAKQKTPVKKEAPGNTEKSMVSKFWDKLKTGYNEIVDNFEIFPVHVRAFSDFVIRRSSPFTEKQLTTKEIEALTAMVKYKEKSGLKSGQIVDFYTIANKLNNGSEQIDFRDKKSLGIDQGDIKSLYTRLAMTIGNAKVTKVGTSYKVEDIYDFNNYARNPEKYTLDKMPETMKAAFHKIGTGNFVQGVEELASYNQKLGYSGYKIEINLIA